MVPPDRNRRDVKARRAALTAAHVPSRRHTGVYLTLVGLLATSLVLSAAVGAFTFTPARIATLTAQLLGWVPPAPADALDRNVFIQLRLPRVLLAGLTGAVLGVSGTLMQGLFRNPIVEPGLVGTSAGAAFGAAIVFVFGAGTFTRPLGPWPSRPSRSPARSPPR